MLVSQPWLQQYGLGIELSVKHLAGKENVHANHLSCLLLHCEWQLHPRMFKFLDRIWGPHTYDRSFCQFHKQSNPGFRQRELYPTATTAAKLDTCVPVINSHPRTAPQSQMEGQCLAHLWKEKLTTMGWDHCPLPNCLYTGPCPHCPFITSR